VLIIGINGFLGKYLNGFLTKRGFEVFGTSHSISDKQIFKLKIGDKIGEDILNKNFHTVIYLAHSYNSSEQNKLIEWYKNIFIQFQPVVKKQIYISSYSANEFAYSNYGVTKYKIERFFLKNLGYTISPGLIIGDGGIYKKIKRMVDISPILFVPVCKAKNNLLPIINIDKVACVILKLIDKDYKQRSYNIYEDMVVFIEFVKDIAKTHNKKRFIYPFNAKIILNILKSLEYLRIKLPVNSDNLQGFIANQSYRRDSDIDIFCKKDNL
jgi:nucleoside-diphosphate-sugar epimerase